MFRVLDLFSGIGGFSLGLERTNGFETIAFCEIEPFCQKVLKKHWPNVPIFEDIKELNNNIEQLDYLRPIDVICGGFPCQDLSYAGKGGGIHAERSGLWWEMVKTIGLLRPKYVIIENVAAILGRGFSDVLISLAKERYNVEWEIIRAQDFGLLHERERLFAIAYLMRERSNTFIFQERIDNEKFREKWNDSNVSSIYIEDFKRAYPIYREFLREGNGVSTRLDETKRRVKALGNSIVPQCTEFIGNLILEYEKENNI